VEFALAVWTMPKMPNAKTTANKVKRTFSFIFLLLHVVLVLETVLKATSTALKAL
jgi:hypothetical protein